MACVLLPPVFVSTGGIRDSVGILLDPDKALV